MKTYHILLTTAVALLFSVGIQAKPRTEALMKQAASQAIQTHRASMMKAPRKGQVQLMAKQSHLSVMGFSDGGFAIVADDDLLPAVLGYSDKAFDTENQADGFRWWFQAMSEAADYYVKNQVQAKVVKPDASKVQPRVLPLLATEWGQEEPFNNACPLLPDAEAYPRHCVTGCVATATAQILNYHKYPSTGYGTTTLQVPYGDPTGTTYSMDFSQCHFDWANMRNTYTVGNYTEAEAKAVADLMHAMGMMAIMQYGLDTSGAISDDAAEGLQNYFGLSTATLYMRNDIFGFSENYNETEWSNMIFQELSSVGPVYYAGADADDQGGHAFVFDGYNEDGLVHVNWGWHGRFDGYYDVSLLNPRIYRFTKGQEMILGICPPEKMKGYNYFISLTEAGTLATELQAVENLMGTDKAIQGITISGPMNADDLRTLAEKHTLSSIDLTNATLEGDLLPARAFYGCTNLSTLKLPVSLRFMGDGALAGCSNLNELVVPEGDDKGYAVEGGVVYNPDRTEVIAVLPTAEDSVTIAEGVTRIHDYAFEGCKHVRIVTLPATVTSLGDRSMANVLIMRELHMLGATPAAVGNETFAGVDPGFLMLYLPAGSRNSYEQAAGWSALFKSDNVTEVGTVIRARDITRNYGEEVEEYYFEIIGQRVKGMPLLTCEATKDSPAGDYPIVVSMGSVEADNVTLVNGTLTVVGGPVGLNGASSVQDDNASTFNLGYCNGEVSEKSQLGGMGDNYTSAAIFVPAATLQGMAGCTIGKIRAGLATRLNVDELSVWVRSSLNGDNLAEGKLNRKQTRVLQGWNEVALSTAYTIPEECEGLYIGYTYHHTSLANAVSVVGTTPAGTAFFQSAEGAQWQDISSNGALSIEAVVSGSTLKQFDLAMVSAQLVPDLTENFTSYKLTAQVSNLGTKDVEGFDISVSAPGIDDVTSHVAQLVPSGRQVTVAVSFDAAATIANGSLVAVSISALDNANDELSSNNSAEAAIAFERNVLLEEFTTESCPNCPRGAETTHAALNGNTEFATRVNVVCHHSAFGTDWLTKDCDTELLWLFNEGGQTYAPSWMADRQPYFEANLGGTAKQAIFSTNDTKTMIEILEGEMQVPANVALGAKATLADGKVSITVNGLRDDAFDMSNPLLTVYLTEDNVKAVNQQGTSGAGSDFLHQHVIRAYNNAWGEAVEWNNNTFTTTVAFDADSSWKTADLKAVAFLANYDSTDNLNCIVANSTGTAVIPAEAQSVKPLTTTAAPNTATYNLRGQRVATGSRGLVIVKHADGTVTKTIMK